MQSDRVVKALKLSDAMFKQLFGVQKETFHTMHNILYQALQSQHRQGGRPPKLTVGDKLLLTFSTGESTEEWIILLTNMKSTKATSIVPSFGSNRP